MFFSSHVITGLALRIKPEPVVTQLDKITTTITKKDHKRQLLK